MAFTDNFGNPKGLLGRLMLVSMDKEHLPMVMTRNPLCKEMCAEARMGRDSSTDFFT